MRVKVMMGSGGECVRRMQKSRWILCMQHLLGHQSLHVLRSRCAADGARGGITRVGGIDGGRVAQAR